MKGNSSKRKLHRQPSYDSEFCDASIETENPAKQGTGRGNEDVINAIGDCNVSGGKANERVSMQNQVLNASTSTAPRQDPTPLALKTATVGDFALPPIHPTPTVAPILSQSNLASKFGLKNKNKIGF